MYYDRCIILVPFLCKSIVQGLVEMGNYEELTPLPHCVEWINRADFNKSQSLIVSVACIVTFILRVL